MFTVYQHKNKINGKVYILSGFESDETTDKEIKN